MRARAMATRSELVKFVADAKTDRVLGYTSSGRWPASSSPRRWPRWSSARPLRTRHHQPPHPSLSEAMKDAALAVDKRAINI